MPILAGYLMPHPPIMLPEVGRDEVLKVSKTLDAARRIGKEVETLTPETVVLITPHGPVFRDGLCVSTSKKLYGDLRDFGVPGVRLSLKNDLELAEKLIEKGREDRISVFPFDEKMTTSYGMTSGLDHGALVPLYFLRGAVSFKLVHICMGLLPYRELYHFGRMIQDAVQEMGKKVVVVASGDLSHRLIPGAPAGFHPEAEKFDRKLITYLKEFEVEKILNMDEHLIEKAGECGFRPIIIMLGSLDGFSINPEILSYEGPFGVGYCVARFEIKGG